VQTFKAVLLLPELISDSTLAIVESEISASLGAKYDSASNLGATLTLKEQNARVMYQLTVKIWNEEEVDLSEVQDVLIEFYADLAEEDARFQSANWSALEEVVDSRTTETDESSPDDSSDGVSPSKVAIIAALTIIVLFFAYGFYVLAGKNDPLFPNDACFPNDSIGDGQKKAEGGVHAVDANQEITFIEMGHKRTPGSLNVDPLYDQDTDKGEINAGGRSP